jgi:hypothetical protein
VAADTRALPTTSPTPRASLSNKLKALVRDLKNKCAKQGAKKADLGSLLEKLAATLAPRRAKKRAAAAAAVSAAKAADTSLFYDVACMWVQWEGMEAGVGTTAARAARRASPDCSLGAAHCAASTFDAVEAAQEAEDATRIAVDAAARYRAHADWARGEATSARPGLEPCFEAQALVTLEEHFAEVTRTRLEAVAAALTVWRRSAPCARRAARADAAAKRAAAGATLDDDCASCAAAMFDRAEAAEAALPRDVRARVACALAAAEAAAIDWLVDRVIVSMRVTLEVLTMTTPIYV